MYNVGLLRHCYARCMFIISLVVLVTTLVSATSAFPLDTWTRVSSRLRAMNFGSAINSGSAMNSESAMTFCRSSPDAVVVSVWPRAHSQTSAVRSWLESNDAEILFTSEVSLNVTSGVPTIMALYQGEDWIHNNCWYGESPLPSGPPAQPYAGAKWKAELTFTESDIQTLSVFVIDAKKTKTKGSLWSGKYGIREELRRAVGGLGNCCLHLTDDQKFALGNSVGKNAAGGYECDSSYAFHCSRVLLDESSIHFLTDARHDVDGFEENWKKYEAWLSNPNDNIGTAPQYNTTK